MNRRSFLKKASGWFIFGFLISTSFYYYARKIEPSSLTINEYSIPSHKVDASVDGFKIIQFSDTHIGFHYSLEQLKNLVSTINDEKPDVVVFTGDLIDNPYTFNEYKEVATILQSLDAPYGKFWVYGNHDHGGYGTELIEEMMTSAQFKLLRNQSSTIVKNNAMIQIAGLDDGILGKPLIKKTMTNIHSNHFTFLLAHEPDLADITKTYPVDLQLSGHSHGGQIQLPFIGPIITPALARKYVEGSYNFSQSNMKLFVNRGIGTTRLPFRFLCKPEISIYTLHAKIHSR